MTRDHITIVKNDQELKYIVDQIVKTVVPLKIYLFGSYARGNNHKNSDYDLYVVIKDGTGNRTKKIQDIYMAIAEHRSTPVDILLDYESAFEDKKSGPTIEREVEGAGILLYKA